MNKKFYLLIPFIIGIIPVFSQSDLLDNVKNNPEEAIKLCEKFKEFNSRGISVNSDEAVNYVSRKNNISQINAEILSIYVVGLHCPNII